MGRISGADAGWPIFATGLWLRDRYDQLARAGRIQSPHIRSLGAEDNQALREGFPLQGKLVSNRKRPFGESIDASAAALSRLRGFGR